MRTSSTWVEMTLATEPEQQVLSAQVVLASSSNENLLLTLPYFRPEPCSRWTILNHRSFLHRTSLVPPQHGISSPYAAMASESMTFASIQSIIFTSSIQVFFNAILPTMDFTTVYSPRFPIRLIICIRAVSVPMQTMIFLSLLRLTDAISRSRVMKRQARWNDSIRKNKQTIAAKPPTLYARLTARPRYPLLEILASWVGALRMMWFLYV